MSKEELLSKLKALADEGGASEEGHMEADSLLLEWINDSEISEAYAAIEKWYA